MTVTNNASIDSMSGGPNPTPGVNDQLTAGTPSPDQTGGVPRTDAQANSVVASATQPDPSQAAANNQNQTAADKTNPTPTAPAPQEKPHLLSRTFDGILKTMIGGPVMYTDLNGVRREAPQSRGAMGKAIVAAALAGLMTPTQYREGAFGTKVEDFGATAGGAAAAGKGVMDAFRNKPQQISDEEQTKKLQTMMNTANLATTMAASTLQQHNAAQVMTEDAAPIWDSIQQYEKVRDSEQQPAALIQDNLNHKEALAKLKGHHGDWSALYRGTKPQLNPETGETEDIPYYAVVNTNVKVPLTEEAVKLYSTVNPTYKGAWEATNGHVVVPMNMAVAAQNLVNESHVLQSFANSAEMKSAFPKVKPANIASVIGGPDGKRVAQALDATRDAIAAGAPAYQTLNALQSAPGGRTLMEALGLDPGAVNDYVKTKTNEAIREHALATEGGVGDKAPVSEQQQKTLQSAINRVEDPEERASLTAMIPPDRPLTMGEFQKVGNELRQTVQRLHEAKMKTGDPVVLQSEADSMLNGNVSNPKDLATIRSGGARMLIDSLLQKGAEARGLNPVNHTFATQEAKARSYAEYSDPQSKIGAQLSSFDTLMRHTAEGLDANEKWVRSSSPLVNEKLNWLAENATNDQDYQTFRDTIIAPAKEYMNFLNQNRAEHESDIRAMDGILGKDATAKSALTALRVITQTADARAAGLGQKYLNTVKNNYSGLISPTALQVMQRFGIKSQAGPMSVELPRGWQGNSASPLTPQAKQAYWEASGHNAQYATELAKENGWR
jgi:hypothetical protein